MVVAITMLIAAGGSLIGMSLPCLLSKLRLDLATGSASLVPFMSDVAVVLVYFGIASALLGGERLRILHPVEV